MGLKDYILKYNSKIYFKNVLYLIMTIQINNIANQKISFTSGKSDLSKPPVQQTSITLTPLEKDVVTITQPHKQVLDKTTTACQYFGVDTPENLAENLAHQALLNKSNKFWSFNHKQGKILTLNGLYLLEKQSANKEYLNKAIGLSHYGKKWTMVDEIKLQGAAKLTLADKSFGSHGIHTIGMVYKDNKLYVLDSLGENTPKQKSIHEKIYNLFTEVGFENIIFSTKAQQSFDEYTCNNWTYANINTVLKELYDKNTKIETSEQLNNILRDDINTILEEQYIKAIWTD